MLDTSGTRGPGSARSTRVYDKSSFQVMKNSDLPHIKKLLEDDDHPDLLQSCQALEDLAQEQNFDFEYIQLPSSNGGRSTRSTVVCLSLDPLFPGATQLLLELRLIPVSVFHGCDTTFDQARQKAANLALKYIRHLSKQQQQQQQQNSSSMIVTTPVISQTA